MILFDADALYVALDKQRRERRVRWNEVAADCGVSKSLFTRLAYGKSPSTDGVVRLLRWLGTTDLAPYIREDTDGGH